MAEKGLVFDKDFLKRGKGGYVFLSHSHKDIEDVRIIRNIFEEKGFEPLCFYLKCLDKNQIKLLKALIKSEIDARDFFVYIESENAEASGWVKYERKCVKESGKSQNSIFRINLDEFRNNQQCDVKLEAEIERIVSSKRVFLSYAAEDKEIADKIAEALKKKDFKVWTDFDIRLGSMWQFELQKALDEAAKYGYIIPIISKHSTREDSLLRLELAYSEELNARFIPIRVDGAIPPLSLITHQIIFLNNDNFDEKMNRIVEIIESNQYSE